jgi:hypothetical protein
MAHFEKKRLLEKERSFKDDPLVVEKTNEPAFFWLEPGVGVILIGSLLERDKLKRSLSWLIALGGGTYLASVKNPLAKASALALATYACIPFGETRYVRFLFGMASVMRLLRVVEVLIDPKYFEDRGAMYTIKFCFLYVSSLFLR